MKNGILIQARSGSKRFPRKIFAPFRGKPLLAHVIKACQDVPDAFVAVLGPHGDHALDIFCRDRIPYYENSENDLVSRYIAGIRHFDLQTCVRVTGDCPLVPTWMIEQAVKALSHKDYVSNTMVRSFPDGYDVQGATRDAWLWLDRMQHEEREHPWREFDVNERVRALFVEEGFTIHQLLNPANPIFEKLSVDTEDELKTLNERP